MLNSIIKVKDKVEYLLNKNHVFRDNDNKLIARIWLSEIITNDANDFLKSFGNGNHTSPEAIRRARQKLQEQNPSLRGSLYNKRHKNSVKVRQNINKI